MTEPDRSSQPWLHKDSGLPPDRAFFRELLRDLFDEQERVAMAREERFKHYLLWLSVRWAAIWVLLVALLWLLLQVGRLMLLNKWDR